MVEGSILESASIILNQLPELLFISDIAFYFFGSLFFGSIAIKGFRGYLHPLPHFGLRALLGFLCLLGGLGLRGFFAFLNSGIYQLFSIDILAGSIVLSGLLCVSLYLVSFRLLNIQALTKRASDIQERIKKAKKIPHNKLGWKDPLKIAGIALIIAITAFSLLSFRGFPRTSENFLNFMGLSPADLEELTKQAENIQQMEKNLPEGCVSPFSIMQTKGFDFSKLPSYDNPSLKTLIQKQASSPVLDMRKTSFEGNTFIIALTENSQACSATETQVCSCIDVMLR